MTENCTHSDQINIRTDDGNKKSTAYHTVSFLVEI